MNKHRHDNRQATVRKAMLVIANHPKIPCEIMDFCNGGIFLRFVGQDGGPTTFDGRVGTCVVIHFASSSRAEAFHLRGRIAHVADRGIGVAFLEPHPVAALLDLQEMATRVSHTVSGPADKMLDAKTIVRNCCQLLDEALRNVLGDFFAKIDSALFIAAQQADTNAKQAAFFEAATQLKANRSAIESGFLSKALKKAENMTATEPSQLEDASASPTGGLSLVDKLEFEDWLNLSDQAFKLEGEHESVICLLEQRFTSLAHRDISHKNNAYRPSVLGHAFRVTLSNLCLHNSAKHILYGVFAKALNTRLHVLYQRLDEITRNIGSALPAITNSHPQGTTGNQPINEAPGVELTPTGGPRPGPGEAAGLPAILRAVGALSNLYTQTRPPQSPAATTGGGGGDARVTQATMSNGSGVETLGALFNVILSDIALNQGLKPYFRQLQAPLLEATVADPALLCAETHPALETLNLLDNLAIGINAKGEIESPALQEQLNGITQRIGREAGKNPAVFAEVNEQLAKMTAPLLKAKSLRINRVREVCEGGQRLENARRRVEQEVDSRLGGKQVPAIVPDLLDNGWRHLLVLTALRQGWKSEAWQRRWGLLDKLLEWLGREAENAAILLPEAHLLIDFVDEQLMTVCLDHAVHNRIMNELTALLLGEGIPRQKRPPRFVFVPASKKDEGRDVGMNEAQRAQLEKFSIGDWINFSPKPGVWLPLRLTWIGEKPTRYVFVNQKGGKEIEFGTDEFARHLDEQRAVKTVSLDLPLMERTANILIETMQEKFRYHAIHDPVTGLINRKEFIRQLDRYLARESSTDGGGMVGLIEVDQFRVINNLCGMDAGDQLLREICDIMEQTLNEEDMLARMGDSHFGLLFGPGSGSEGHSQAGELIRRLSDHHFKYGQRSFSLGVNMGLVACTPGRSDVNSLIKNADAACLAAREKGRNLIHLYEEDDASLKASKTLMDWAGRIDKILEENRLFMRCQLIKPIFQERGMNAHYEVLLGIRDEEGNLVPPAVFVSAAERWKRMPEIDRWMVRSVFGWMRRNPESFRKAGGFSINFSGQSINSDEFLDFLHNQFAAGDLPLEKVTFEITETVAIDEFKQAEKLIRQVKRYGCKFSLDDFGSGFSSYAYLKNLQMDYLKIDGSIVKDMASSPTDYAMVNSMNEIGHSLGMRTIAEYVENEAILDKLREIGVDYAQGFGIGKPVPIEEL